MASTSSSTRTNRKEEESLYETWMNLQREELTELEQAATQARNGHINDQELTKLIQKITNNFQEYSNNRKRLAQIDAPTFFAPISCTPLENSVLWIGGCRPSSFIRFIYSLCGIEIESHLTEFFQGTKIGELSDLTAKQITMVDELQGKTITEERELCSRLSSLQANIVDQPLPSKLKKDNGDDQGDQYSENAYERLDEQIHEMATVVEEADELRMKTLQEITSLLTPAQAVEYLAAAKRLRLCFQQWGKKRDHEHTNKLNSVD
ncbi:protein DOG1-like 3 [Nicotiana tabacum]|uniref:Protein DOG1-like 3 n=2 Tax=Nicotiana TaxID=4085 RepID=A0A1S3ZMS5_TOBAC|nr:PREDICTED: transcription factor TGA3-like [Nicotiana sylvestris]XP_016465662.1 PREDICTED: transcription factor TGA3-like [Nicotiana tabacum]